MLKKAIFSLIIFIFSIHVLVGAEGKIRIAILPFSSRGGVEKSVVELVSENFTIKMIEIGDFSVVERSQLDKALSELKFQKDDVFDDSASVEIGKLVGAQIVIIGSITALGTLGNDFYVSARGIDVKTGVAIFAKREEAKSRKSLISVVDKLATTISKESGSKSSRDDSKDDAKKLVENKNAEREEKLKAEKEKQELLKLELELKKKKEKRNSKKRKREKRQKDKRN